MSIPVAELSNAQCATLYHEVFTQARDAESMALRHWVKCGCLLMAVRDRLPDGPYGDWLAANGINLKRATRQVSLARDFGDAMGMLDKARLDAAVAKWNAMYEDCPGMQIKGDVSVRRGLDVAAASRRGFQPETKQQRPRVGAGVRVAEGIENETSQGWGGGIEAGDEDGDGYGDGYEGKMGGDGWNGGGYDEDGEDGEDDVAERRTPDEGGEDAQSGVDGSREPQPGDFVEHEDYLMARQRWAAERAGPPTPSEVSEYVNRAHTHAAGPAAVSTPAAAPPPWGSNPASPRSVGLAGGQSSVEAVKIGETAGVSTAGDRRPALPAGFAPARPPGVRPPVRVGPQLSMASLYESAQAAREMATRIEGATLDGDRQRRIDDATRRYVAECSEILADRRDADAQTTGGVA